MSIIVNTICMAPSYDHLVPPSFTVASQPTIGDTMSYRSSAWATMSPTYFMHFV